MTRVRRPNRPILKKAFSAIKRFARAALMRIEWETGCEMLPGEFLLFHARVLLLGLHLMYG